MEPSRREAYMETCRLRVMAQAAIMDAMETAGLSRTELAGDLGVLPEAVAKVLDGERDITLEDLAEYGLACGVRWKFVGVSATDPDKVMVDG